MAKKEKNTVKKKRGWLIVGLILLGLVLAAGGLTWGMGILSLARDLFVLGIGTSAGIGAGVGAAAIVRGIKSARANSKNKTKTLEKNKDLEREENLEQIPVETKEKEGYVPPITSSKEKSAKNVR